MDLSASEVMPLGPGVLPFVMWRMVTLTSLRVGGSARCKKVGCCGIKSSTVGLQGRGMLVVEDLLKVGAEDFSILFVGWHLGPASLAHRDGAA
eukprot:2068123-Ditylum_brightwellii.AAC.1